MQTIIAGQNYFMRYIYTIVQSGDLTIATFNEMTTNVFERLVT